jgi:hypothetical protein
VSVVVYKVSEMVKEGETAQEVKERRRGERETEKHSMVANNFTVKEQQRSKDLRIFRYRKEWCSI